MQALLTSTHWTALALRDDHPGARGALARLVLAAVKSVFTFTGLALVDVPCLTVLQLFTVITASKAALCVEARENVIITKILTTASKNNIA